MTAVTETDRGGGTLREEEEEDASLPSFQRGARSLSSASSSSVSSWAELQRLHAASPLCCSPSSLQSMVEWIALEGGKQGCSAQHLHDIVSRHTTPAAAEAALDMETMEYWWTQLRQHPQLAFFSVDASASSTSSSTASSSSPPPARAAPQNAYERISVVQAKQRLQLTEDGVLLPPFQRELLPAPSLSLSFSSARTRYPGMVAVASQSLRQAVIGWSEAASAMSAQLSASFSFVVPKGSAAATKAAAASSSSAAADEDKDASFLSASSYCCAETLGKAAYDGLYGTELTALLSMTAGNLHHLLLLLRVRGLLISTEDRGKQRLFLHPWKQRGDEQPAVLEQRRLRFLEWYDSHHSKWKSRANRLKSQLLQQPQQAAGGDDDGGSSSLLVDEYSWSLQPAPAFTLSLSVPDQLYRAIAAAGSSGITVAGLRKRLGGMGLRSFDRVLASLAGDAGMGVVSVVDRVGKSISYRFLTRAAWEERRRQEGLGEQKDREVIQLDEKGEEEGREDGSGVEQEAKAGSRSGKEEKKQPESEDGAKDGSRLAASRSTPLLVLQRRRTALSLLSAAPHRLLSFASLLRSLGAAHPPVMTVKTARAFFSSLADDGLVQLLTFQFPHVHGHSSYQVLVVWGRKVVKVEEAKQRQEEDAQQREQEEEEEHDPVQLQARAYEIALQQMKESRGVSRKAVKVEKEDGQLEKAEEDEAADEQAAAAEEERKDTTPVRRRSRRTEGASAGEDETKDGSRDSDEEWEPGSEEAASVSGSETDAATTSRAGTRAGLSGELSRVKVSRSLFGFIRPQLARAHYLHGLLWSEYQSDDSPIVTAVPSSSSSSSSPLLTFQYADLVHRCYLRDFLLLTGLVVKGDECASLLSEPGLLQRRLDQLPAPLRRTVIGCIREYSLRHLHHCLSLLQRLRLIVPMLNGQPAPLSEEQLHALSLTSSSPHAAYCLTASVSTTATARLQQSFSFSSPEQLEAYWQLLRTESLKPGGRRRADSDSTVCSFSLPASSLRLLRQPRRWLYRAVRSGTQQQNLLFFEAAAGAGGLSLDQLMRAARVTKLPAVSAATFYSRRLWPQLAAIHDRLGCYSEDAAGEKSDIEPAVETAPRKRRKKQMKVEGQGDSSRPPRRRRRKASSKAQDELSAQQPSEQEAEQTAAEGKEEGSEPAASASASASGAAAAPKTRRRVNASWSAAEDAQLVCLYNEWLQLQAAAGALPFSYRAPPTVDLSVDDGLGVDFPVPLTSSLSPSAAALHTLLLLMPNTSTWQPAPASSQQAEPGSRPQSPLPSSTPVSSSSAALSGRRGGLLIQAKSDYVLHEKPLPDLAKLKQQEREEQEEKKPQRPHEKEEKEEDSREAGEREGDEQDELAVAAAVSPAWSLLSSFCLHAASQLQTRDAAQIRHRLQQFSLRLSLPARRSRLSAGYSGLQAALLEAGSSSSATTSSTSAVASLASLTSLLKQIVLEPAASYSPSVAHAVTARYSDRQVSAVLSLLLQQHWIKRGSNQQGTARSWRLTTACDAMLKGGAAVGEEEDDSAEVEPGLDASEEMERIRREWREGPAGEEVLLQHPVTRLQVEAALQAVRAGELELLLAQSQPQDEADEEMKGEEEKQSAVSAPREQHTVQTQHTAEAQRTEELKAEQRAPKRGQAMEVEDEVPAAAGRSETEQRDEQPLQQDERKEEARVEMRRPSAVVRRASAMAEWDLTGDGVLRLLNTCWHRIEPHKPNSSSSGSASLPLSSNILSGEEVKGRDEDVEEDEETAVLVAAKARKRRRRAARNDNAEEDTEAAGPVDDLNARREEDAVLEEAEAKADSLLVQLLPQQGDTAELQPTGGNRATAALLDSDRCIRLSEQIAQELLEAGSAGLSAQELRQRMGDPSADTEAGRELDCGLPPPLSSAFNLALHRALSASLIVRVFAFSHPCFVHQSFLSFHSALPAAAASSSSASGSPDDARSSAVVSHPWRLLSGDVNASVWRGLYNGVLRCVRQWPGVTEARLRTVFPVLTLMELRHVLHTLVMDDAVYRRCLITAQRQQAGAAVSSEQSGEGESVKAPRADLQDRRTGREDGEEESGDLIVCYFAVLRHY